MSIKSPFADLPECSSPVNKQAAVGVIRRFREEWTRSECPELHPTPFPEIVKRASIDSYRKYGKSISHQEDPTGCKYSHMTVIGFVRKNDKDRGFARGCVFAVRCDCGMYETRTLYKIRRKISLGQVDCCEKCMTKELKTTIKGEHK